MKIDPVRLSKKMALALRHQPWLFELELDEEGWTSSETLLSALQESRREWADLKMEDIEKVVATSDKKRYEIQGDQIRALYGHSIAAKIIKTPAEPPTLLYHGTAQKFLANIMKEGLKPMRRQYVHFSVDQATAIQVGKRKGDKTILLTILAGDAHQKGITFYKGNDLIWLADALMPEFIRLPEG